MIEYTKIAIQIMSGAIPILWFFSWLMFLKKNKFEKMCGVLSLSLIFIGIFHCIRTAVGLV